MAEAALVLTTTQRQRPASGVFFIQYLSLILIILTVIAGSLTRRVPLGADVRAAPSAPWTEVVSLGRPLIEWSNWAPLESLPRQCEQQGKWASLRFVLQQHDVTLQVELLAPTTFVALEYIEAIREVLEVTAPDAVHISTWIASSHRGTELRTRFVSAPQVQEGGV